MQVQRIAWEAIKQGYQEGEKQISSETILSSRQKRAPYLGWRPHCHGATHKSRLEKKRLEKTQWDLRDAGLAAVILASGVWMIIAGLMKLWANRKAGLFARLSRAWLPLSSRECLHVIMQDCKPYENCLCGMQC